MLEGKVITIGVCACSPAPQVTELIMALKRKGAQVHVILTPNARNFVSDILIQRAAGTPIQVEQFELPKVYDTGHKSLSGASDLLLIAPASANTIGKAAGGIADNLLSTTVLSARCPIVIAMHMNPAFYAKKSVQRNIEWLKEDGVVFVESDGPMASLFPSIGRIVETVEKVLGE